MTGCLGTWIYTACSLGWGEENVQRHKFKINVNVLISGRVVADSSCVHLCDQNEDAVGS